MNVEVAITVQELCESRGGHPGLPIRNSAYGLCGCKATLQDEGQLMMWLDHHLLSSWCRLFSFDSLPSVESCLALIVFRLWRVLSSDSLPSTESCLALTVFRVWRAV